MSPRAIVVAVALIALGAGCQNIDQAMNAVKPLAQQVPVVGGYADTAAKGVHAGSLLAQSASTFTPEQEYYVGRAVSAQVLANPKFTQTSNQGLQDYVSNVGQAVALGSSSVKMPYQGYRFVVLESPTVNAFSAPGGYVFITTGAIAKAQNEEELAGVLAHEIAHVSLDHGIRSIKQSNLTEALTIIGSEAASRSNVQLAHVFGDSVQDIVVTSITNGYSRGQEMEADSTAVIYLRESGYSPGGLVEYLRHNDFDTGGFRSDHPSASDRVAALTAAVGGQGDTSGTQARTARFKQAAGS
jgi:beta-barrel assembly-enhancing protease